MIAASDVVIKVRGPEEDEARSLKDGQTLISFLWPAQNPELLELFFESRTSAPTRPVPVMQSRSAARIGADCKSEEHFNFAK